MNGDWRQAYAWAIITITAFALPAVIAFIIGQKVAEMGLS